MARLGLEGPWLVRSLALDPVWAAWRRLL